MTLFARTIAFAHGEMPAIFSTPNPSAFMAREGHKRLCGYIFTAFSLRVLSAPLR